MPKDKPGKLGTRGLRFHEANDFETAAKRYGAWPSTVWEINDSHGADKSLKKALGDFGKARKGSLKTVGLSKSDVMPVSTSIFPPMVAHQILALYAREPMEIFDPFAGGGTRAVMAASAGHKYTGIEIRQDEVNSIEALCDEHGVRDSVNIICGDAREPYTKTNHFDFCFTCPPYWTLEQYQGGPKDLSMIQDYDDFIDALWPVVCQTKRTLKPGSISCWVVGLHRKKDGVSLAPLNHDIARLHTDAGFIFREEVCIFRNNPMAMKRVGNFERGHRLLIRQHEYCLVFEKPKEM